MQLQPFSVNDGDGIRTTIFMAGCPLRCRWCSNPEGFTAQEKVGWYQRKRIGCGACAAICPQKIDIPGIMRKLDENVKSRPSWAQLCREREETARKLKEGK